MEQYLSEVKVIIDEYKEIHHQYLEIEKKLQDLQSEKDKLLHRLTENRKKDAQLMTRVGNDGINYSDLIKISQ